MITEEWEEYKEKVVPEELDPEIVRLIRNAYHAGATSCLALAGEGHGEEILAELEQFYRSDP